MVGNTELSTRFRETSVLPVIRPKPAQREKLSFQVPRLAEIPTNRQTSRTDSFPVDGLASGSHTSKS
jgi:hypothetical protein